MELGAFSISLAVSDIAVSRAFYEKLGFRVVAGEQEQRWLILANGQTVIGLFQGMFEKNSLTFNPGWTQQMGMLDTFTDVRDIEKQLREAGIPIIQGTSGESGPSHVVIADPDGNPILIDQHR